MMQLINALNIDATVIVALIGLFGTIYTVKTNTLLQHNKQLIEMIENQQNELRELKEQHTVESERLEKKISILTEENAELRKEVAALRCELAKQSF